MYTKIKNFLKSHLNERFDEVFKEFVHRFHEFAVESSYSESPKYIIDWNVETKIIGYTKENILIKTNWTNSIINIPISFISNFREIWNIEIESPEDTFLNKELKNFLL